MIEGLLTTASILKLALRRCALEKDTLLLLPLFSLFFVKVKQSTHCGGSISRKSWKLNLKWCFVGVVRHRVFASYAQMNKNWYLCSGSDTNDTNRLEQAQQGISALKGAVSWVFGFNFAFFCFFNFTIYSTLFWFCFSYVVSYTGYRLRILYS